MPPTTNAIMETLRTHPLLSVAYMWAATWLLDITVLTKTLGYVAGVVLTIITIYAKLMEISEIKRKRKEEE